ncbi:MAG TPA: hypothetical protein VN602_12900 [Gemmatimonadaceae bacterium]|nr:hypothetical protein [Gemmatimonadaceae bacterium]
MGVTAATVVIIAKERDLVAHFRRVGALSAASAKSVRELGVDNSRVWYLLERRGIIRDAGQARYFLDEVAWAADRTRRRRVAVAVLVLALGMLAVGVLVAVRAAAHHG